MLEARMPGAVTAQGNDVELAWIQVAANAQVKARYNSRAKM